MNARLARQSYGKHQVHISRVIRLEDSTHRFSQVAVDVELEGNFEAAYTEGDNSLVVATDTCKNLVHNVALEHTIESIESFGRSLVEVFLQNYRHVDQVTTSLTETIWDRLNDCPHGFIASNRAMPTAQAVGKRGSALQIVSGVRDVVIAKTTASGFEDFHRDAYRTLEDTDDRILATSMQANWTYAGEPACYNESREAIMDALMTSFLDHYSKSVQQTLMRMGAAALEACPAIGSIHLIMPNKHHIPIDMSPFGKQNRNDLFVVSPEPFGYIEAEIVRDGV
ncbi:MAG: factor-independent urate hydroxylase [Planctomycetota bacterium]